MSKLTITMILVFVTSIYFMIMGYVALAESSTFWSFISFQRAEIQAVALLRLSIGGVFFCLWSWMLFKYRRKEFFGKSFPEIS